MNPHTRLLLASGAIVDPSVILDEIKATQTNPTRVGVDRHAGVVSPLEAEQEQQLNLRERLGSTLSGTGVTVANRALRKPGFRLAKDIPELAPLLTDVAEEANRVLDRGGSVIIEGTQGFGLSIYHSTDYPYATSRDTTSSGFLSEVGVSPRLVADIIMAIRTFPIRVGGNSGPLPNEITWEDVRQHSGYPVAIAEYTTTTKRLRRVASYSADLVRRAVMVNRPTQLALHGVDYLDYSNLSVASFARLSTNALEFITQLEADLGVPVSLIGTGPANEDLIDRGVSR